MRAVLWLLLLANLGYLGWSLYQLKAVEPAPVVASSRGAVERLHLVEETPAGDVSSPTAAAAQEEPAPPPPETTVEGGALGEDETTPDRPSPAPAATPPGTPAAADDEPGEGPAPGSVVTRCVLLGPLPEEADTDDLRTLLEDKGMTVATETRQDRRPNRYWIYLPPFADITAAREALERLRDAGVTDFIRVMRGPNVNAVSLGLYSRESSARARMDELESKGFEPAMDVRHEEVDQTWLRITLAADARLPRDELAALLDTVPQVRSCP